jgi:Ca2+-binding EF-hand superfamily protein
MGNKTFKQNYSQKVKYGGFSKEDIENYKQFFSKNLADNNGQLNKKKLMKYLKLEST